MQQVGFTIDVDKLPAVLDQNTALERLNDWRSETAENCPSLLDLSHFPEVQALLLGVFANSPFLSQVIHQESETLKRLFEMGPDHSFDEIRSWLLAALPKVDNKPDLMQLLRVAKRRVALVTALADIAGCWSLDQVTGALSALAEIAVQYSVAFLLRERMRRGDLSWTTDEFAPLSPDISRSTGYFVLAMGKLGANELNYSSDIDLIVFFDGDAAEYRGKRDIQDCFIRITRDLVTVLQERTADGYVFRTDLRLRPDPGATPVAISTDAAEIYYQSVGLNWERSAMIKARPLAGDIAAGDAFLARIRGFVWRKHLDYAALEDIHSIKNRIHDHHGQRNICVAGQNVKVGPGGIREIEFFVQAHQLIFGGRETQFRVRPTLDGLNALRQSGRLTDDEAASLVNAYVFLRTLEHRLQMMRDEQTHTIPESRDGVAQIAAFMGYQTTPAFEADVLQQLRSVKEKYDSFFADAHVGEAPDHEKWGGLFTNEWENTGLLKDINALGFDDADRVVEIARGWESGRYRSLRTPRARDLLKGITPTILGTLGRTSEPDRALSRFDEFLIRLPSGVQILSLFQANPILLEVLAEVLGTAPALADFIAGNHLLLDAVLSPSFFVPVSHVPPDENDLSRVLETARDFQDVMDFTRRWANERKFQIGVQILRQLINAEEAAQAQTKIAEAVVSDLLPAVQNEFAHRHGTIPDSALAVIAMGSFGARETSFTSDLDMIFVYDTPAADSVSDGERPLPASQYFARLSQRLINALSALTGEGRLYEVDMRLRPSGNAGPVAVSVKAFETYQRKDAWTWEHMALTRARPIAGPEPLQRQLSTIIQNVLSLPRDEIETLKAVADMRHRIEVEQSTDKIWAVKQVRGGLLDLEFLAQAIQLSSAHLHPEILHPQTAKAFEAFARAGLIQSDIAGELADACRLLGAVRGFSRQCLGGDFDPKQQTSEAIRKAISKTAGTAHFDELTELVTATEKRVSTIFNEMIIDRL